MTLTRPVPTSVERFFNEDEIIVSKTDKKGIITYCNRTFLEVAGYTEAEMLGQPHNVIRHPDMPRCVFKLLWDTISAGSEIFAFVKNMAKDGAFYWVNAHVTPTFDTSGSIVGYHSNRRVPGRRAVAQMGELYRELKKIEDSQADWRKGMALAHTEMVRVLAQANMQYDEFVFSLED